MRTEVLIPLYDSLMKLCRDYEDGIDDHDCATKDFHRCEKCDRSWEARTMLGNQVDLILALLRKYHDALAELSLSVIQEVPLPRPDSVQKALLKALKLQEQPR